MTHHDTPLVIVESTAHLEEVAEKLAKAPVLGIDTESDSLYSYREKVCLIQISDLESDYIIDPLADCDVAVLAPILADRSIPKVLHGADYDVVCLKRDFGFQTQNLFDTLIAAQLLGMAKKGLADLIERFFGVTVDKQYQRHDWSRRPLRAEHLAYARGDTHWLPALREILHRRVSLVGRVDHLHEECALLEQREWMGRSFEPDGYLSMRGGSTLDDMGKRVLRRLYLYRNESAERMDRPVFKVIPDDVLVRVARLRPQSSAELDRLFGGKSAMKRRHGAQLVEAVIRGMDDDFPIPRQKRKPRRKKPKGPRPRLTGRSAERALAGLKRWRNDLVDGSEDLTPYLVASNSTLKAIASLRPRTLDELEGIPDVRTWQVRDFGPDILEVLERVDPTRERESSG